ncbi:CBS domain-containing protein [Streptomyces sp. NPDC018972]|uniref:CBS domain-containing protein n=1 Tax=Streptomyces sp. NPDC018972 TaxID=3365060 RepID=UPI0037ABA078
MDGGPYTVSGVMTRAVVAVGRDTPFEDVVRLVEEWRAGALPVPEGEGRVVGVDGTVAALETDGVPRRPAPAGA